MHEKGPLTHAFRYDTSLYPSFNGREITEQRKNKIDTTSPTPLLLLFPHADTPIPVNLHLIDSGALTLRSASTKRRETGTVGLWNWDWCEAGGGW